MVENFLTVLEQVIILFVLIGIGAILGKTKLLGDTGAKGMANIVMYLVTPCTIIMSFQREFDAAMLVNLGIALLASLVSMMVLIVIAHLVYARYGDDSKKRVLRFAVVFSNCGYMCLPLQGALLGDDGLFYGASYVAMFNLLVWSYGLVSISGDRKEISGKKLALNPGILGLAVGLALFLTSVKLPNVIGTPMQHLANLNTPVPMILVGYYLSQDNLLEAIRNKSNYGAVVLRLIVAPVISIGGMYLCGIRGTMLVALAIASSAPVAAITTIFAAKYNREVKTSVQLVSLSTLFSSLTMPVLVALTQLIA